MHPRPMTATPVEKQGHNGGGAQKTRKNGQSDRSTVEPGDLAPRIRPSKSGSRGGKYDLVDSNSAISCCKQEFASPEDTGSRDHFCCDSTRFPKNSADSRRRDSDNIAPSHAHYNNAPRFCQKLAGQQRALSLKSKPA